MEKEKYVDESWKDSAAHSKDHLEKVIGEKEASGQNQSGDDSSKIHVPGKEHAERSEHEPSGEEQPMDQDAVEQAQAMEVNFLNYMTSLAVQAMIFLGEIPHPMTNQQEKNVEQARLLIDTLSMLRDKTKGNLTKQEEDFLNGSIYELQLKYVEASEGKAENAG